MLIFVHTYFILFFILIFSRPDDPDWDSDVEMPRERPSGLTMRLGSKKQNPTQSVSHVIQKIVYRQYSSSDDSE